MTFESVAGLALVIALAALVGALASGWIGRRLGAVNIRLEKGFQDISTLVQQSGKTTRESLEALRGALSETERAFGTKLDDGLKAGFDRTLAMISEGAKAQTAQIDIFRADVAALGGAMTKLGTEVPASLETARANAKLDAA